MRTPERSDARRKTACRAVAIVMLAPLLASCPMPFPVCERKDLVVLQVPVIDLRSWSAAREVPKNFGIVFGRIDVTGVGVAGRISANLVAFEGDEPKAAREVWLQPDGAFHWALPAANYVIEPAKFNHDYREGSYQRSLTLHPRASFRAEAGPSPTYLGVLRIAVDDGRIVRGVFHEEYVVMSTGVHDDVDADLSILAPDATQTRASVRRRLMTHDATMKAPVVPRTPVCHDWNICWGVYFLTAGACFNEDG